MVHERKDKWQEYVLDPMDRMPIDLLGMHGLH